MKLARLWVSKYDTHDDTNAMLTDRDFGCKIHRVDLSASDHIILSTYIKLVFDEVSEPMGDEIGCL